MTLEQLRKNNWIILEVISGSHAYGTDIKTSDVDIRGIYIQPAIEILGHSTSYIPQVSDSNNDITFYEIGRFLELAAKGNPNILELLNVDERFIIHKDLRYDKIFTPELKESFLTMRLKHSFTGFAYAQIQKAKGLNKKINWDETKMQRRDVLDFCYVLLDRESTVKFKVFQKMTRRIGKYIYKPGSCVNENVGLAKVNNMPDLYSMYFMPDYGGIVSEESNDVQLKSIPKDADHIGYLRFDRNAYSQHCKDYKSYQTWLQERNEGRYTDNLKGEQGYDHKNMLHCMRLLGMAEDIADGKGIVVMRPNRDYLLSIRNGEVPYNELIADADAFIEKINEKFDQSDLPHSFPVKKLDQLIRQIRLESMI